MRYYRPAKDEDFVDIEITYRNHMIMSGRTKKFIRDGAIEIAMNEIKNIFGFGLMEAKTYCNEYAKFLQAKTDYLEGKPVFVEY